MAMSAELQDAYNDQITLEFASCYAYLQMAAFLEDGNLPGFANWMRQQAEEERVHAMKFFDFINDRGGQVTLAQIAGPKTQWNSPLAAFQDAYKHECKISGLINKLVDLSVAESDHAANAFLQWFVSEQVEEEATADEIVGKLKLAVHGGPAPSVEYKAQAPHVALSAAYLYQNSTEANPLPPASAAVAVKPSGLALCQYGVIASTFDVGGVASIGNQFACKAKSISHWFVSAPGAVL